MKWTPLVTLLSAVAALLGAAVLVAVAAAQDRPDVLWRLDAPLVNHLQAGMNEQDVFLARNGRAFRATANDAISGPLFAAAHGVDHDPASDETGPFDLGAPLGFDLDAWLAGRGELAASCGGDGGRVVATFERLVPDAVYTVWESHVAMPPTVPFKALDLPLGALDGSQNTFVTDASGSARFEAELAQCLPLSSDRLATVVAIAYHSDGRTHGIEPGAFGADSHVQLFAFLPTEAQLEAARR